MVGVESDDKDLPQNINLSQNYPNPFNPSTIINFKLPLKSFVSLKVYDVLGREIKTLISGERKSGIYNIAFRAEELSSGIYFYKLEAGDFIQTKKMILLK